MYVLFSPPAASVVIAGASEHATSYGAEFLPLLYVAVGIIAAVVLVKYLRRRVSSGIGKVGRK